MNNTEFEVALMVAANRAENCKIDLAYTIKAIERMYLSGNDGSDYHRDILSEAKRLAEALKIYDPSWGEMRLLLETGMALRNRFSIALVDYL